MKKLLLIIGLLIVLFVGALIAIPLLVDPNDYKEQIIAQVEKHTGRTLSLPGDLKMSKFPSLGVDIGEMSFGNAAGFGDAPMIQSGYASVSVKVMPLLKKDLQVSTLTLRDVVINLAVDESGKTNWDDLTGHSGTAKKEDSGDSKKLAAFALGGIDLENARVVWDDRSMGKKYTISDLNFKTGKLELNQPVDVDMTGRIDASAEGIVADLTLDGTIEYDLDNRRYTIKPLDFTGKLQGESIPGGATDVSLQSTSAQIDLKNGTLDIAGFDLSALGTKVKGDIAASRIFDKIPLASGQLTIDSQSIPDLLNALGQDASMPLKSLQAETKLSSTADSMKLENLSAKAILDGDQIPNSPVDVTLNTTADVNLTNETLNVENFTIKGMGLDVQGSVKGTQIIKNPNINGSFKVAPFNLRELMTQMNMEIPVTADAKVLNNVGLTSNFNVTKQAFKLNDLAMKLDDTNITGTLGLNNFSNPTPDFNLNIDSINADRYMPPKSDEKAPVAATPAGAASGGDLPLDSLRNLNAKGSLSIGELIISSAKLSNVKVGLDAKGGKINLNPTQANLYKGSYNGSVSLDATGSQPAMSMNSTLAGVQAAPLLTDLTGKSKIDGTMAGKINITGTGANANSFKKTLNGTADFDFSDGAILGVNIARIIRQAKAKLSGKTLAATSEPEKTDFSELGASVNIKNGLVDNQDFLMKSPFLRVTGAGNADLPSENINYRIVTTLVGSIKGQGGEGLEELKGIDIPVKVSGTFSKPKYAPDLGGVLKAKVDKEIDKQKEKLQEKAKDKLKGVLPGDLGGLLGGSKGEATEGAAAPAESAPAEPEKNVEEQAKDKLKGLLKF